MEPCTYIGWTDWNLHRKLKYINAVWYIPVSVTWTKHREKKSGPVWPPCTRLSYSEGPWPFTLYLSLSLCLLTAKMSGIIGFCIHLYEAIILGCENLTILYATVSWGRFQKVPATNHDSMNNLLFPTNAFPLTLINIKQTVAQKQKKLPIFACIS